MDNKANKKSMVFTTTVNRINYLYKDNHDTQNIRVGWKLSIDYSEYGVNRMYVEVLNITTVSNDNEETQLNLNDWQIHKPINTDGIVTWGLWPQDITIQGKTITINFK